MCQSIFSAPPSKCPKQQSKINFFSISIITILIKYQWCVLLFDTVFPLFHYEEFIFGNKHFDLPYQMVQMTHNLYLNGEIRIRRQDAKMLALSDFVAGLLLLHFWLVLVLLHGLDYYYPKIILIITISPHSVLC